MTTNATSAAPPLPGSSSGGLPPSLPPGFDTPVPGSTTGGGTTPAPTTPPPTGGTNTGFVPTTTGGGPTFQTIPAPGLCTTPPVPGGGGKDPIQGPPGKDPIQGGGAVAGVSGEALKPVLEQLTKVIGQLGTLVGGTSGGGAPGKTPEQGAPPKTPAQDATQGGGQVAGANGGGAPAKPAGKECDMPGHKDATQGGGASPSSSTVAGANGAGASNAAQGAGQVQGGGGAATNESLVAALKGVIEALNALVKQLGGASVEAGGPGGKNDPAQKTPPTPPTPPPGDVAGDKGPGKDPTQAPPKGDVGGDQGPGQKPEQKPEQKPVTPPPVTPPPPTDVAGDQGPGQKPTQSPVQGPPPKVEPPKVDGANGGPKPEQKPEQKPTQTPEQKPKPKPPVVAQGNVILDNDDDKWSAKLTAKGPGKAGDSSVELWGDPHVVAVIDGKEQKFDIGHGAGSVTLFDGTKITWDTYAKGDKHQFILRDFKIDSPGSKFDRAVTTRDRNGDKGDEMNLTTALTEQHLKEFATALSGMKGPMNESLRNGTWVSPEYGKTPQQGNPNQVGQS